MRGIAAVADGMRFVWQEPELWRVIWFLTSEERQPLPGIRAIATLAVCGTSEAA